MKKLALLGLSLLLTHCAHQAPKVSKTAEKARLYLQLATEQYTKGEFAKSRLSSLKALKEKSDYAPALNQLGLAYMEMKQYERSAQAFTRALEARSNYPEVRNNIGVMLNRQGKYKDALQQFKLALKDQNYITPEAAWTNMGYALYRLGKSRQAKRFHQRALDLVPQFCLANKNMGDVYAKEKKFKKANGYYRKAVTYCPLFQEGQYKLALTWIRTGDKRQAKTELRRLIKKHKSGPYVKRSQRALQHLN